MNAVIETAAPGAELTITQREVLRAARASGRLESHPAGGVAAIDGRGMRLSTRFPRRTINALERSGYLARTRDGYSLTSAGRAAAGVV